MSLQVYHRKRDFKKTAEPKGKAGKASSHLYLIQKHAARRLHYDFRLALDGVLKSWAVPKGPSLNPADKRLAVHVEDHPLDYGSFEGTIPKGEYGGGTVMMWDRGEWSPVGDPHEGYEKGHLKFQLKGQRLKGQWALIRMGGRHGDDKNWLLVKDKDEMADPKRELTEEFDTSVITRRSLNEIAIQAPAKQEAAQSAPKKKAAARTGAAPAKAKKSTFPETFRPQLATLAQAVPQEDGWIHEVKYDGYRLLAFVQNGKARLMTRNELDWTDRFPSIAEAVAQLPVKNAIIDGEIVVQKEDGTTDFQALQNAIRNKERERLVFYVFDLPFLNGADLTRTPLIERKNKLLEILGGDKSLKEGAVRFSGHIEGHGTDVFKNACHFALEGIMSKRADSEYRQERSTDWLKVKCAHRQEFVIGGYTAPKGSRNHFGSLLLGYYENGKLIYAGHVGTGFNNKVLQSLFKELQKREQTKSPFASPVEDKLRREVTWVKPDLVGEIQFAGWTEDKILRHPSFEGLREDKKGKDVVLETPKVNSQASEESSDTVAGVTLTHPDKILYPEQGVTKRDLCHYYEAVAAWMLPHIKGRPLSLVRCPRGEGQACFFQKHLTESAPDSVRGVEIEEKKTKGTYIVIDNVHGLVSLVQLGVLEFHPWPCTEKDIEKPDRLIFDLDPAPGIKMENIVTAARLVRDRLADSGLTSFVKTTGGKGLHVVAPVQPKLNWDDFRAYAEKVAADIVKEEPDRYIATMSKARRTGKIFIDFFRNNRGATAVAPYSSRAREGATVSMPLSWDELTPKLKLDQFTVKTVPKLLQENGKAWRGFFETRQSL